MTNMHDYLKRFTIKKIKLQTLQASFLELTEVNITTSAYKTCFTFFFHTSLLANLLARHLAFIFVLMNFHILAFSAAVSTGNLLKTNTFMEFNLLLSRHRLPWVPSVLLFVSSSLVKKYGRSLTAHLCLSCSLSRASCTLFTLLGVTHVRMTSSPTLTLTVFTALLASTGNGADGVAAGGGVAAECGTGVTSAEGRLSTSSFKLTNVSTSIVLRSWKGGTLGEKLTDNGSRFSAEPENWKIKINNNDKSVTIDQFPVRRTKKKWDWSWSAWNGGWALV